MSLRQEVRSAVRKANGIPAIVRAINDHLVNVQLGRSGNGAWLHNIRLIGGPVTVGQLVYVEYSTNVPVATTYSVDTVGATGPAPTPSAPESAGAEWPMILALLQGEIIGRFPITAAGLDGALKSGGDLTWVPPCYLANEKGGYGTLPQHEGEINLVVPDGMDVVGSGRYATYIGNMITALGNNHFELLTIWGGQAEIPAEQYHDVPAFVASGDIVLQDVRIFGTSIPQPYDPEIHRGYGIVNNGDTTIDAYNSTIEARMDAVASNIPNTSGSTAAGHFVLNLYGSHLYSWWEMDANQSGDSTINSWDSTFDPLKVSGPPINNHTSGSTSGSGAGYMTDLMDVDLTGLSDQDHLAWDAASQTWKPVAALQFDGLTKITVGATEPTSPNVGDIWINTA